MADSNLPVPKPIRRMLAAPHARSRGAARQRQLMLGALALLLVALGLLLYADRDFWFPETQEAEDQPETPVPALRAETPSAIANRSAVAGEGANARHSKHTPRSKRGNDGEAVAEASVLPISISERTVLPPLEVEVVAGNKHRILLPGSNSVHLEWEKGSSATNPVDTAAGVTSEAADRVAVSSPSSEIVSQTVEPDYPLLARQMKVQGSVVLQALIGRDGLIQNLRVISGSPILASAAQEAVKQWHFKPHYQGSQPVETQANITVNFTISTN